MPFQLEPDICRTVLESLPNGLYLVDRDRRILLWSSGAERITGYLAQEVIGRFCQDDLLMHCTDDGTVICGKCCPLLDTMHDGHPREVDLFLRHKDGQRVPVRVRSAPVRNSEGTVIGAVETFEERSLLPDVEVSTHGREIHACMDELTGVPDHVSTESYLNAMIEDYKEDRVPVGVLTISIVGLDEFRQSHGVKGAEAMLRAVARTLARNLHPPDVVGRWSGDRFLVIVPNCPASVLARAAAMLKQIVEHAGISWWGDRVSIAVSMGGAEVREGDTAESLVERCEHALASSLVGGGDRVSVL